MNKRTLATFAAVLTTLFTTHVNAQTVVADYTLDGTDFNSTTGSPGYAPRSDGALEAVDSVNGYNEGGYYNDGNLGTFGTSSIGGPTTAPTYFPSAGLGWYGAAIPGVTNDFTVSLYEQTSDTGQTSALISSNDANQGSIQIGIENNEFVAVIDSGSGGNLSGTILGSFAVNSGDNKLSLTDINGVFTFSDNGVNAAPTTDLTDAAATNFGNFYIGVGPGAYDNFEGYMSDITITTGVTSLAPVPEPSTYLMMGLGLLTLVAVGRFRRLQA